MENLWKPLAIVFFALFVSLVVFSLLGTPSQAGKMPLSGPSSRNISGQADGAMNFIRSNLIGSGESVRLVNVSEENGVDRLSIEYASASGKQIIDVFVTSDGKYLFPVSYRLNDGSRTGGSTPVATGSSAASPTCAGTVKQDIPVLEAFVVSYCPYGIQMQNILGEIVEKIPVLGAHIKVRFIGEISNGTIRSMHGPTEAAENLKQICIREEQSDMYWKYVSCFLNLSGSSSCISGAGIDSVKLSGCTSDPGRGIRYAKEDFTRASGYSISSSPTLVLNGARVSEFNFGGRSPEAVKSLLCCGFANQPGACSTTLGSGTTPGQGSC